MEARTVRRNGREKLVARARRLLTDERLMMILRAMVQEMADRRMPADAWPDIAGDLVGPPMAVPLINECLDRGESLDQIFYTGKHGNAKRDAFNSGSSHQGADGIAKLSGILGGAHVECAYSKATHGNINVVTTVKTEPLATFVRSAP